MPDPTTIEVMYELATAMCDGPPQLGDDALIYAGSALWSQWENHVPLAIISLWPSLGREARLAVFLTCKAITNMNERSPSDA